MYSNLDPNRAVYLVAGRQSEYNNYLYAMHKNNPEQYNKFHFKYVANTDQLRGLDFIQGFYIGTWYDRDDIQRIQFEIKIIKSKITL